MIRFLLKGLLRDRSRSLFPIIVVALGVMLTVTFQAYMKGVFGEIARSNANFNTGHVKVMSKAYAENSAQIPNDLALLGVEELRSSLQKRYPDMKWVERIRFGGLLDVPDENGETRSQGPTSGLAADLFSTESDEITTLNIPGSIVRGQLPGKPGEILISDDFATKLKVSIGDEVTLMSSTMHGSMSMYNFSIAGTVRFGIVAMDKGSIIVDISDIRRALDMEDAAGELLGYFDDGRYHDEQAVSIATEFNREFSNSDDEFAPIMVALRDQDGLGEYMDLGNYMGFILSAIFIFAMSIVLWNVGLIGGLRRYGEMGLRLAIGENKGHVYGSLILESMLVGVIGSVVGTAIGLSFSWYLQVHGFDIGSMIQNSSMMVSSVFRAQITPTTFYIGFIPGVFSTILGSVLSGRGIYKRQTAQLFKELET